MLKGKMNRQQSVMAEELHTLLQRAKAGDQEALGKVLQALRPFLLQIANREIEPKLRQKASSSDIVQQTLMEAAQAVGDFEGSPEAFLTWIRRILLNNIANSRRHFQTSKRNLHLEVPISNESSVGMRPGELATPDPSQSDILTKQESIDAVAAALATLSLDYQQVISLRNERKLTFQEIGQCINRSEDAARKLWARAIESLKAAMDRQSQ